MASTTNYSWSTPDDTALVKDGAAAIRSLGSAIDTTTKALNPSTTLGDIEYRSATANTNTRLGIGTTGQVLSVVGGVPAWATAGASENLELLNAGGTALTGATTITVSGISNKSKLFLVVINGSSANAYSQFQVRVNSVATGYALSGIAYTPGSSYSSTDLSSGGGASTTEIGFGGMSADAASRINGWLKIEGANTSSTYPKMYFSSAGGSAAGAALNQATWYGGVINSVNSITSVSLISSTGNFDNGTLYVYGV